MAAILTSLFSCIGQMTEVLTPDIYIELNEVYNQDF
jgi:hypothetical protein